MNVLKLTLRKICDIVFYVPKHLLLISCMDLNNYPHNWFTRLIRITIRLLILPFILFVMLIIGLMELSVYVTSKIVNFIYDEDMLDTEFFFFKSFAGVLKIWE